MKKIVIMAFLHLSIFGIVSSLSAQKSPGYMGKKVAFGYRFRFMPGLGGNPSARQDYTLDPANGTEAPDRFKINTFHEGFIEIVSGNKSTVLLRGVYSKAQFSPYTDGNSFSGYPIDWASYTAVGGSIGIRKYSKHLAPLSRYIGVSAGWQQVIVDEFITISEYSDVYEVNTFPSATGGSLTSAVEVGTNHIYFDKMVINYSFEFKFILGSLFNFRGVGGKVYFDDQMVYSAIKRMQLEQIFSFGIGIGFLP